MTDFGKVFKRYKDCIVYVKDVGELPIDVQKEWFKLWDNVIINKFKEFYREYWAKELNVKWYDLPNDLKNPDFEYDKKDGFITVWTKEGKEFFQTVISGILYTRTELDGETIIKQSYELYGHGGGNSEDSISFDFRGTKV